METLQVVVLAISGLAMLYASSIRLINPTKANFLQIYLANPGNTLENDVDLINEIRGIGAVMLLGGIIILLGTIVPDFRFTSFVVAIVLFFGVATGRLISFGLDGKPNKDIVKAVIVEMVLCPLHIFCLANILLQ